MMNAFLGFLIALVISYLLTPLVRRIAINSGVMDVPDARRVHKEPIPRWGGLAIYAGVIAASLIMYPTANLWDGDFQVLGLLAMGGLVVVMGALDDKLQFSAVIQAGFLLAMGILVQAFGVQIQGLSRPLAPAHTNYNPQTMWLDLGWLAIPFTALWMFVVTKTMDTIDGLDGLAAGVGAIIAGAITIMSIQSKQPEVAVVAAAAGGAAVGFWRHNYNPAKIFMGTGGAQFLGFLLAGLAVIGTYKQVTIVVMGVALIAFGLPLFDAFFVIYRRWRNGEPITQADKRHLHHRLLEKGFNQKQAVLVLYAVTFVLSAVAIAVFNLARAR